jgi:hypothetical protein
VNLDSFVAEIRTDIERFAKFWQDGHRSDPNNFPSAFHTENAGMWFEQFIAFVNHGTK